MIKRTFLFVAFVFMLFPNFVSALNLGLELPNQGDIQNGYVSLAPGETVKGYFVVSNGGVSKVELKMDTADAFMDSAGDISANDFTLEQFGAGNWLKSELSEPVFSVNSNSTFKVPFSINIPTNVAPGDYVGAFIVMDGTEVVFDTSKIQGAGAEVKVFYVRPIKIHVSGEEVVKVNHVDFQLSYDAAGRSINFVNILTNYGNVAMNSDVVIDIKNKLSNNTIQPLTKILTLMPSKDEISVLASWNALPMFGFFDVKSNISFNKFSFGVVDKSSPINSEKSLSFWIVPWHVVSAIFVGFSALFFIVAFILHLRSKELASYTVYTVKKGETLLSIASKFNMKWKKLAKINDIQAPYLLSSGAKIKVITTK